MRSSVAYGVVRMLGYWSRNTDRFRIFHSRREAEAWLERHIDQAPPGLVRFGDVEQGAGRGAKAGPDMAVAGL